jgi:hypothetical protein
MEDNLTGLVWQDKGRKVLDICEKEPLVKTSFLQAFNFDPCALQKHHGA